MSKESIEDLQQRIFHEQICRRILDGQPRGKIASELNLTPATLRQLLYSDTFLETAKGYNEELWEDLKQEIQEGENQAYEEVIESSAVEAAKHLRDALSGGNSSTGSISAAKAIIELAERIAKKGQDRQGEGLGHIPKRQWDKLQEAMGEIKRQ